MTQPRNLFTTSQQALRACLLAVCVVFIAVDFAHSDSSKIISAEQSKAQAAAGELLIIDVRTSAE